MLKQLTSVDCETQQRLKRKSKSSSSGDKPKSAKTPTANQRVKLLYWGHRQQLFSVQPLKNWFSTVTLLRDDRVLMNGMVRTIAWLVSLVFVMLLSSGVYWPIRYSIIGLTEGLKSVSRGCRRFFSSRVLPHSSIPPCLAFISTRPTPCAFALTERSF